jgi:hypothetical protein
MVENMMAFINFFMLPLISLYIHSKRGAKELVFTFETICIYSIFLSAGIVCNKAIMVVIRMLFMTDINISSGFYTIIGVFTFVLLPILFEIVKQHFSIRIEAKNEKK